MARIVRLMKLTITLIGEAIETLQPMSVRWVLDRPISNSGRLAKRIRDAARQKQWNWTVEVAFNPDAEISTSDRIVISADSHVLDESATWLNLNRFLIDKQLDQLWLIDLS